MTLCAICQLVPGCIQLGHFEDDGEFLIFVFERWACGFCASEACAWE